MYRALAAKIVHALKWRFIHYYHTHIWMNDLLALLYALKTCVVYKMKRPKSRHILTQQIVVSLTSYPPRFGILSLTLKCLLRQSVSPDKLILWIAREDIEKLPREISKLADNRLFEIRVCEDIGPYKKIVPALQAFPEAIIITADDDVYYPPDWLENLIRSWDGDCNTIVAHRVHRIVMEAKDTPASYLKWEMDIQDNDQVKYNFATGIGGVLYPPNSLLPQTINHNDFMRCALSADDIWLFWMGRMGGSKVIKSKVKYQFITWFASQKNGLFRQNIKMCKNDEKIGFMIEEFGWPVC